jgi:hypothetical protein
VGEESAPFRRTGDPRTIFTLLLATGCRRRMIESITYTESGKPNIKLVSKEFAHPARRAFGRRWTLLRSPRRSCSPHF